MQKNPDEKNLVTKNQPPSFYGHTYYVNIHTCVHLEYRGKKDNNNYCRESKDLHSKRVYVLLFIVVIIIIIMIILLLFHAG